MADKDLTLGFNLSYIQGKNLALQGENISEKNREKSLEIEFDFDSHEIKYGFSDENGKLEVLELSEKTRNSVEGMIKRYLEYYYVHNASQKEIEALWDNLGNVAFDESEEKHDQVLGENWFIFDKGTPRNDIWRFFDTAERERNLNVNYLLYEYDPYESKTHALSYYNRNDVLAFQGFLENYPEVLEKFEEQWQKVNAPDITDEQKEFVSDIISSVSGRLEESYKKHLESLKALVENDKKHSNEWIISADVAKESKEALDKKQNQIAFSFKHFTGLCIDYLSDYLEKNKGMAFKDEFINYAHHQISNMLLDVKCGELRNAKYGEHGYDFSLLRKSLEKVMGSSDFKTFFIDRLQDVYEIQSVTDNKILEQFETLLATNEEIKAEKLSKEWQDTLCNNRVNKAVEIITNHYRNYCKDEGFDGYEKLDKELKAYADKIQNMNLIDREGIIQGVFESIGEQYDNETGLCTVETFLNDSETVEIHYSFEEIAALIKAVDVIKYGTPSLDFVRPNSLALKEGVENSDEFKDLITGYYISGDAYEDLTNNKLIDTANSYNKNNELINIEKNDQMSVFEHDTDAALQYCRDNNCKLLTEGIDIWTGLSKGYNSLIPDNKRNREILKELLLDKPLSEKFLWKGFTEENFNKLVEDIRNFRKTGEFKGEDFRGKVNLGAISIEFVQSDPSVDFLDINYYFLGQEGEGSLEFKNADATVPYSYENGETLSFDLIEICRDYEDFKTKVQTQLIHDIEGVSEYRKEAIVPTIDWENVGECTQYYSKKLGDELYEVYSRNALSMSEEDKNDALRLIDMGADCKKVLLDVAADANLYENCHWFIENISDYLLKEYFADKDFANVMYEKAKESMTSDRGSGFDGISDVGFHGFLEIAELCSRSADAYEEYFNVLREDKLVTEIFPGENKKSNHDALYDVIKKHMPEYEPTLRQLKTFIDYIGSEDFNAHLFVGNGEYDKDFILLDDDDLKKPLINFGDVLARVALNAARDAVLAHDSPVAKQVDEKASMLAGFSKEYDKTHFDFAKLADDICQTAYDRSAAGFNYLMDWEDVVELANRTEFWVKENKEHIIDELENHNDELLLDFSEQWVTEEGFELNFCSVGEDYNELFKQDKNGRWVRRTPDELQKLDYGTEEEKVGAYERDADFRLDSASVHPLVSVIKPDGDNDVELTMYAKEDSPLKDFVAGWKDKKGDVILFVTLGTDGNVRELKGFVEDGNDGEAMENLLSPKSLNGKLIPQLELAVYKAIEESVASNTPYLTPRERFFSKPEPVRGFTRNVDLTDFMNTKNRKRGEPEIYDENADAILRYLGWADYKLYESRDGKLCMLDVSEDFTGEGGVGFSNADVINAAYYQAQKAREDMADAYSEESFRLVKKMYDSYVENGYIKAKDFENEKEKTESLSFAGDVDKMLDWDELSKEEFLDTYSYLTEEEYDATARELSEKGLTGMQQVEILDKEVDTEQILHDVFDVNADILDPIIDEIRVWHPELYGREKDDNLHLLVEFHNNEELTGAVFSTEEILEDFSKSGITYNGKEIEAYVINTDEGKSISAFLEELGKKEISLDLSGKVLPMKNHLQDEPSVEKFIDSEVNIPDSELYGKKFTADLIELNRKMKDPWASLKILTAQAKRNPEDNRLLHKWFDDNGFTTSKDKIEDYFRKNGMELPKKEASRNQKDKAREGR